jgi:hypothetical protein
MATKGGDGGMKKFGEVFFFAVVGWAVWIIFATSPSDRISRACAPVGWIGSGFTAAVRAANTDLGNNFKTGSQTADYRCKLWVWDMMYAKQWEAAHPGQPLPGVQNGK